MGSRPNRVLAVIVAIVLLVGVITLVVSLGRNEVSYEPGSPEAAAQAYLRAALDGDFDAAAELLDPSSDCDAADLDRAYVPEMAGVNLLETVTDGDRSRVRIEVEYPSGGPFGDRGREEHTLRLVRADGTWLLTGIPWPLYDCTRPSP